MPVVQIAVDAVLLHALELTQLAQDLVKSSTDSSPHVFPMCECDPVATQGMDVDLRAIALSFLTYPQV